MEPDETGKRVRNNRGWQSLGGQNPRKASGPAESRGGFVRERMLGHSMTRYAAWPVLCWKRRTNGRLDIREGAAPCPAALVRVVGSTRDGKENSQKKRGPEIGVDLVETVNKPSPCVTICENRKSDGNDDSARPNTATGGRPCSSLGCSIGYVRSGSKLAQPALRTSTRLAHSGTAGTWARRA